MNSIKVYKLEELSGEARNRANHYAQPDRVELPKGYVSAVQKRAKELADAHGITIYSPHVNIHNPIQLYMDLVFTNKEVFDNFINKNNLDRTQLAPLLSALDILTIWQFQCNIRTNISIERAGLGRVSRLHDSCQKNEHTKYLINIYRKISKSIAVEIQKLCQELMAKAKKVEKKDYGFFFADGSPVSKEFSIEKKS